MLKKKFNCHNRDEADDFVARTKEQFKGHDLVLTEGVKVILPAGWIHVRPSNTEPVIRVIAEGNDQREIEDLVNQII